MMKILVSLIISLVLFLSVSVSAEDLDIEIEDKINSIVHYAEEYEVGNINYFQLNVHGHKIRSDLNLLLGGGIGNEWARIPKENVEKAFGVPADYTYWVWVDNKNMEKRFDDAMPWWERVIFDGRKVRIVFNAFPSAIEMENGTLFRYYSVDFNLRFKKEFNFDLDGMMKEVASLAVDYNMTRTKKSGEVLARKMLETQSIFGRYAQENSEQCMEIMETVFTPEEKSTKEKVVWWKFPLYSGSDFDVMVNVDMCEECEFHYVNFMLDVEGRGPRNVFSSPELQSGKLEHKIDEEYFRTLSIDDVQKEFEKTIFEVRDEAKKFDKTRSSDFPKKFFFNRFKVQQLNRILDEKYNNVQNDKGMMQKIASGELQGPGGCKNVSDCRKYCEKMENTQECRKFTYNLRVDLLEKMFAGFKIEKTPHDRIWWERRIFENIGLRQDSWCRHVNDIQCKEDEGCVDGECVLALGGNETCDNREDDDEDRLADCQDPDCWKERQCGKLCEKVCNKEGGCWQTSNEMCSGVCKECWDCGGDEKCKSICEPECWPCHNQEAIKNVCDDCRTCEDEAYGGCYVKCKPCDACNTNRMEKMKAIFDRAAREGIKTPGGCMIEEECTRYCAEHGEECGDTLDKLGFYSEEFDCNAECKECMTCNYDKGNAVCRANQYFERDSGFCVCDKGWFDCDGDGYNGCESNKQCRAGTCFEECEKCDTCKEGEDCKSLCLECNKCRNPNMPTYLCDGVEQSEPCSAEYTCNGVKQKKPCENYVCNGRKSTKPCDEITNLTCGKNQILIENECICREGFKDCDNDGNCEPTKSCGLEICDDGKDNNDDGSVDCQDMKCNRQVCGIEGSKELLCINKICMLPEEETPPKEPEPICGNHVCEKGEDESCPEDCVVCEAYEPPECPNGKIVWKGKDKFGCTLPPICVVTEKECETNEDCPKPKCGVPECVNGECRVIQLLTICEEGCKEGKTKKRECKDGSEIITAVCTANQWVETGYDCHEVPVAPPKSPPEECPPVCAIFCEYGNKLDGRGCPTCECNPPPPKEKIPEEVPEKIAPEVEEETPEARGECVLASNCGGSQDVCSNGNCVTLPIPIEEKIEKKSQQEAPSGEPEPLSEKPSKETESPTSPPKSSSEKQPETSEQSQVTKEGSPTGSFLANFANFLTEGFTGLFIGEESCREECLPCEECNRKFDELVKRIASGEVIGPNNCKNRMECEGYCQREENKEECKAFLFNHDIETFDCWQSFCRECDKCRFKAGELKCNANQQFNLDQGFCECTNGWYECDGDWENGCESDKQCGGCQSKDDCAKDRCAPWGNVIQQFDCFKGEEWVEEKGVLRLEGQCRFYPTKRTESHLAFDMWGEPFFEGLSPIKEGVEREMGWEWCGWELENNIRERIEIQNSFTNASLKWFFEEYVPSSPSEWEKHIGGIYDSYWRIVNNNQQTVENLLCLGRDKIPEEYKPIDVSYNTDFGSVRIWEVETTTDFFGKRTKILSPYMQIWVFPPKEFIKKEFQIAMETGMMPGPEGKQKPELSPSEIEEMKKDKKFMDLINSISDKYGGDAKFLLNVVDGDELVFNALITINPEILVKFEPTRTEGDYDAKIIFDFDFFYSLIRTSEEEMRGTQTEYPPWERGGLKIKDMIKGAVDGVRIWLMINSGIANGSIRSDPAASLWDGLDIMRLMFERGPA